MESIEIKQIFKESAGLIELKYQYWTDSYYDLILEKEEQAWRVHLHLKSFDRRVEKLSESVMFNTYVENPLAFKAVHLREDVGYLQLGHERWNNRLRIWEILVRPEYRRSNIGTQFIRVAIEQAKMVGARALVLETQSCNIPAINFYLKQGFQLIGFDLANYSNWDQQRREIRLEMGLTLTSA